MARVQEHFDDHDEEFDNDSVITAPKYDIKHGKTVRFHQRRWLRHHDDFMVIDGDVYEMTPWSSFYYKVFQRDVTPDSINNYVNRHNAKIKSGRWNRGAPKAFRRMINKAARKAANQSLYADPENFENETVRLPYWD